MQGAGCGLRVAGCGVRVAGCGVQGAGCTGSVRRIDATQLARQDGLFDQLWKQVSKQSVSSQ